MKLTKFPVISPSGAEYRVVVNVSEVITSIATFADVRIKLYAARPKSRVFRWKHLCVYQDLFATAPDIVSLVQAAVIDYETNNVNAYDVIETDGARQFNEWDGRIAE